MSSHAPQNLASPPGTQEPLAPLARTGRLCGARRQARQDVAALLDAALSARGISSARAAERLGVGETVVRHKREGEAGLHLDELLAMGPDVACHVMESLLRGLRGQRVPSRVPVVTRALHCSAAAGAVAARVAEAVADGEVDAAEQRDIAKLTCKLKGASELLLDDCAQGGR